MTEPDPMEDAAEAIAAAQAIEASLDDRAAIAGRATRVLRPPHALRRMDETATWLAGWQRTTKPRVERPAVLIFGADHGVAARGVSAYPTEVTGAIAKAIEGGIATCSALAAAVGATVDLVDVGIGKPTGDLTDTDALDVERFGQAWRAGASAVAEKAAMSDLLVVGEIGIGNTTAAAAVSAGVVGGPLDAWVGRGSGVDDAGLERKRQSVAAGLARLERERAPDSDGHGPLDVLRRLGGAELVALAGATVEARRRSIPMLLDGFIATAGVTPLAAHSPGMLDHCLAGHCSAEPGHRRLLDYLGKHPLLELDLRLGEASGALVALPLLRAAAAVVVDVATFDDLGLPGPTG